MRSPLTNTTPLLHHSKQLVTLILGLFWNRPVCQDVNSFETLLQTPILDIMWIQMFCSCTCSIMMKNVLSQIEIANLYISQLVPENTIFT